MKFIYLTAKKYPGSTADHNYILELAKAFHSELGNNFRFVVCNTLSLEGVDSSLINLNIPNSLKRTIYFFFWIPWFLLKQSNYKPIKSSERIIFFSNDQNLLVILIFWRWLLNLSSHVVADWHLLSNTWKDLCIAKNVDLSITTSEKLKRSISRLIPFSRALTIYGGVNLGAYLQNNSESIQIIRRRLGVPVDKFLVSYIGLFKTLGQEKGIKMMIDSLKYQDQDVVMVFVGGKPDEIVSYGKYAQEIGIKDCCIFLPIQSFEKVVEYQKVMDILVIPYPDQPHFRNYGFPMKVYEYMASKVPIVYTKLELLEEIISDCAFGIKPDNPQEFANMVKYIKSDPELARKKAFLAFEKVKNLDWLSKAKAIISASAIISDMLTIPDKALKYILFQRTEFSIYQTYSWLLRIVMNRRFPIYNFAIKLEALLFPIRTKRLFSIDMEREYAIIKKYLPESPKKILDIGCGVAGIDIMLNKHYSDKNQTPNFYLLDKTEVNSKVYYGLEKKAAYYNSLDIAKELLLANGVRKDKICIQEVDGQSIFPGNKFDLVISLISWRFHYPISTYLDEVYDLLGSGGRLIIDVRKDSDGVDLLKNKFGSVTVIYEARKHQRVLIIKR